MTRIVSFIKRHPVSILFTCLTICIMERIFAFSAQNGTASSQVSSGVSNFIAELLISGFSDFSDAQKFMQVNALVPFIRKLAHLFIFAALGFFSLLSPLFFFKENKKAVPRLKVLLGVLLFCLAYAATDEIHQLFVPDRSASFLDVLIDFSGSIIGMAFAALIFGIFFKIRAKTTKKFKDYQK